MNTPVAFLIFNRPALTERVFERICEARPPRLLVVADGPRTSHPDDAEKCKLAREIVDTGVDWPCEVLRNYSPINLGCRRRVASGLAWVFENVDEAIILEDDCLPDPTFFRYCEELLEKYRNDERIMVISGCKLFREEKVRRESYFFVRYPFIWGWASWRRAWKYYDVEMRLWPRAKQMGWIESILKDKRWIRELCAAFDKTHSGRLDTWDSQLAFACLLQSGLCTSPAHNLVSNIGFGGDATHTPASGPTAQLETLPMDFPLLHPSVMFADDQAEAAALVAIKAKPSLRQRLKAKLSLSHLRRFTNKQT